MNHLISSGEWIDLISFTIIDAVLAIGFWLFLAVFLFLVIHHFTEGKLENAIEKAGKSKIKGPLYAGLIGAIPGCGPAIIMTSLYQRKKVSLGMMSATFIATSGDAAFLLLSRDLRLWFIISLISLVVAIITGYLVDAIFKDKLHLVKKEKKKSEKVAREHKHFYENKFYHLSILFAIVTIVFLSVPAVDLLMGKPIYNNETGFLVSNGFAWFVTLTELITLGIGFLVLIMFILMYFDNGKPHDHELDHSLNFKNSFINGIKQVVYIMFWIMIAMVLLGVIFELIGEENINDFLSTSGVIFVTGALLLGLIPGCGPQIIVTELALTLSGRGHSYAMSGLVGNFMVQDGDAGYPILISNHKLYLFLKITNLIPAIIVSIVALLLWK